MLVRSHHDGGMGAGFGGLGLGDGAGLHHRIQHQAGALLGAPSRSRRGEKTDGARVRVASIAACARVRLRAEMPK